MGQNCCQQRKQDKIVTFFGSERSGKSSLIFYLKNKQELNQIFQSKHIEQAQIKLQGQKYSLLEVQEYSDLVKTDAWVYVMDISKPQEILLINEFLEKLDGKIPVLVYLNKNDLVDSSFSFDTQQIKWNNVKVNKIQQCNNKGDYVDEGFDWLHETLSINVENKE